MTKLKYSLWISLAKPKIVKKINFYSPAILKLADQTQQNEITLFYKNLLLKESAETAEDFYS